MSFKVIETQEDFDAAVKERLARAEKSVRKEFEGFMSPEEVETLKQTYETKLGEQKSYEGFMSPADVEALKKSHASETASLKLDISRMKVAQKNNLPIELASRLQGSNEDELQADAELLLGLMPKETWPSKQAEPPVSGNTNELKGLLSQFRED